jgi:hypothetical protein
LIVIINDTKNPHQSTVTKDITDAILKTHAAGDVLVMYWSKEEQESRLQAAYRKWLKKGKVGCCIKCESVIHEYKLNN